MSELPSNSTRATRVVIVARISTNHQDPLSLVAQTAMCKKYIEDHFPGPHEFRTLATQGSGERLDRAEIAELDELIEKHKVDVVIAEDLGRILRRMHAFLLCEACVDADIRLIAINDRIDTGEANWRMATLFAAFKHEQANADTAMRLTRQLDFNFLGGGCIQHLPVGIIRPPGSKRDSDLSWDPKFTQIYRVMFFLYERGWSVLRITEWLKSQGPESEPSEGQTPAAQSDL